MISLVECTRQINGANVLVTGGAGFIGSHLVDFLLANGVNLVTIVDNFRRPRQDWITSRMGNPRIKWIEADILDLDFNPLLDEKTIIFHLAAISRVMDAAQEPEYTFAVNTLGTVRICESAKRANAQRLVFSSSREVYGDPIRLPVSEEIPIDPKNVYGASKASAEFYLSTRTNHLPPVVILRLANVYGPGDSGRVIPLFLEKAKNGHPLTLYGGDQEIDFIWIDTVIEALVRSAFSLNPIREPINVGSGSVTTVRTLAQRMIELTGNKSQLFVQPARSIEVERFQADLERASFYFGLTASQDSLSYLPEMVKNEKKKND